MTSDAPAGTTADPRFRLGNDGTLEVHEERPAQRFLIAPGAYHPKLVLHPSGRLVAMYREGDFHVGQRARVCVSLSDDGGESWGYSIPIDPRGPDEKTPAIGALPDGTLLALSDGRVLLAYGRRVAPFGVRAILSHDGGRTWDTRRRVTLVADATTRDCGYPSSAQLADGSIVTAYYAAESSGFWKGSFGWHAGPDTLGPHSAVVRYRPEDLPS